MVRFKNRHLLVEFINPSAISTFPAATSPKSALPTTSHPPDCDPEEDLIPIPELPFIHPLSTEPLFDDGTSKIYKAIRSVVQDVFGDEGWGRIASSFKVVYHSPLTTLTIIRVARQHYRLLWGAITMLRSVDGVAVLPRVVAVSGTIKKLQSAAIVHHRRVTAAAVATLLSQGELGNC